VGVGANEVEVEPIGKGLGEEGAATGGRFQSKNSSSTRRWTVSTSLWKVWAAGGMRTCWLSPKAAERPVRWP